MRAAELPTAQTRVLVWDLPIRLSHWALALLVAAAYVTWRLNWMDWHARAGDAVLALVCFRILWGFFGSDTARFAFFLASPRAGLAHLAHGLRREPDRQLGHNPAGGWMVLLLLALLLAETLTGLYVAGNVADEGPLTEITPPAIANALTDLHAWLWQALLAAVALHLLAILIYGVAKGQNLLAPMITGRKRLPRPQSPPRVIGAARAALLAGCGALAAALIIHLLSP